MSRPGYTMTKTTTTRTTVSNAGSSGRGGNQSLGVSKTQYQRSSGSGTGQKYGGRGGVTTTTTTRTETRQVMSGSNKPATVMTKKTVTTNSASALKKTNSPRSSSPRNQPKPTRISSSPGEAKMTRKAIRRGGDFDNILITHIIYSTNPLATFHIFEDLDTQNLYTKPIDLNKLRSNKNLRGPKSGRSQFSSSVEHWVPKPKEKILRSMVFQHSGRKKDQRDLDGSTGRSGMGGSVGKVYTKTSTTVSRGPVKKVVAKTSMRKIN